MKFARQMPVGPYFADFLCRELKLVIELDGHSHDSRSEQDAGRDRWMRAEGYRVLRFTNAEVSENVDGVLAEILTVVREMSASGSPPRCD